MYGALYVLMSGARVAFLGIYIGAMYEGYGCVWSKVGAAYYRKRYDEDE